MAESCLLYYITDRSAFPGDEPARRRGLLEKIAEAGCAGVDFIQLREKDLSGHELESLAREAVRVVRESAPLGFENRERRTALLINSRTDVALAVRADGVHLRSDDISPQEVRAAWVRGAGDYENRQPFDLAERRPTSAFSRENPLIAVSCHSPAEVAHAAASGATLAVFAPVFEKRGLSTTPSDGLAALRQACQNKIPVIALGGVTLENARCCLDVGAGGIAAIRLFQENNIAAVVKQLRG